MTNTKVNERQELFLQTLLKQRKEDGSSYSRSEAYKKAYHTKNLNSARASANRLLQNANVAKRKGELEKEVREEVKAIFTANLKKAANKLVALMDTKNIPEARKSINDVLRLADMEPASKSEVDLKDERIFPGLNDPQGYKEIIESEYRRVSHPEND